MRHHRPSNPMLSRARPLALEGAASAAASVLLSHPARGAIAPGLSQLRLSPLCSGDGAQEVRCGAARGGSASIPSSPRLGPARGWLDP